MFTTQVSLTVAADEQAMAEEAASLLVVQSKEAIARRGVFNIALSGGRTPIPLFQLLTSPKWATAIDWGKTVVYWVDERCEPTESPNSHYGRVRRGLLSKVDVTRFYRMKGEDDPEQAAKAYSNLLMDHFCLIPGEFPRFDCILLGVGADGHIASIFPGDPVLGETEKIVDKVLSANQQPPARLTLTLPVLNNARCCIFLASGRAKNDVLVSALNLMAVPVLPVQMVRPHNGKLCWIIDSTAYQG